MMAGTLLLAFVRVARQAWHAPRRAMLGVRLAWWLLVVSLLARVTSLERLQRLLSPHRASVRAPRLDSASRDARPRASLRETPAQLAGSIDAILRLDLPILRGGRCWKRALVLQRFLARQGLDCRVTFGVRRTAAGALEGHAWLERDGQPLLEPATDEYAVTFTLTPANAGSGARQPTDEARSRGRHP